MPEKIAFIIFLSLSFFISSCKNRIETSKTLPAQDMQRLQKLGLLENDETVYKFYSEYKTDVSGNFYTNKRMASYWIDPDDSLKNKISAAFYKDIIRLDTVYYAGATYCPFLQVTTKDSSHFKVCANGTRPEITGFFTEAINLWKQHKDNP